MSVDTQIFKDTMASWASGVTIVTTVHKAAWKGVTVSAFSSVSADPPLVLVCLNKKLYTHQLLAASGVFAVNVLSHHQFELARLFAGMYPEIQDRFEGKDCFTAKTGSPLFNGTLGWFDCTIVQQYDGGSHSIFVGAVEAADVPADKSGVPLLYQGRDWGQFTPLPDEEA